eukprot:scaffold1521_cov271-Chaetoceros_neogracile.AAC.64
MKAGFEDSRNNLECPVLIIVADHDLILARIHSNHPNLHTLGFYTYQTYGIYCQMLARCPRADHTDCAVLDNVCPQCMPRTNL